MNWNRIALLVITLIVAPLAQAEGPFAGITYGQVSADKADMDNLGFTSGYYSDTGYGFELYYLKTFSEGSRSIAGRSGDVLADTWGIFAVYKSTGDTYFKGRVGYAVVSMELDFDGISSVEDSTSDFAYGLAVGSRIGPGDLELSYTVLPEFDDFKDIDVDADVDMITLSYLWHL